MSLKTLAFTLAKSNTAEKLMRTKYDVQRAAAYEPIDLEILGTYLSVYTINLSDESIDFPISNYNLHIGMTTLITNIFNGK